VREGERKGGEMGDRKIYIASKTKHAARWRDLRASGVNIISTWIDEAGEGESKDLADLAHRCIAEAANADALIIYAEPGDDLKGALVELGAALVYSVQIFAVGPVLKPSSAFTHHRLWREYQSMADALAAARDEEEVSK
jgi:hypothetical protein